MNRIYEICLYDCNNLLFFDPSEGDHKDKKHGYPPVPTDIYGHYCYIFMAIVRDYN